MTKLSQSEHKAIAIREHLSKPRPESYPCGCIGPQNGQPECPCLMQWVEIVDGKYYRINEVRSPDGIRLDATYIGDVK